MHTRHGEMENTYFRTGRCFCICGEWYFSTRENSQVGPFENKDDIDVELIFYLRKFINNNPQIDTQALIAN